MFELISMIVLGIGLVGCVWFAFRHRQYRMLVTAGLVAGVMVRVVASRLYREGRVGIAVADAALWVMLACFALQAVAFYLQIFNGNRTTVADHEARKRKEPA